MAGEAEVAESGDSKARNGNEEWQTEGIAPVQQKFEIRGLDQDDSGRHGQVSTVPDTSLVGCSRLARPWSNHSNPSVGGQLSARPAEAAPSLARALFMEAPVARDETNPQSSGKTHFQEFRFRMNAWANSVPKGEVMINNVQMGAVATDTQGRRVNNCRLSLRERTVFGRVKKWGQAPRVGVILPVVRIGRRSQSPFFHKLGANGEIAVPLRRKVCRQ